MHANKSAYFVTQDQIGSSTLLTNVSGSVADCNAFYPFGEQDSSICATTNTTTHKFTGKERDSESNLDNFGARYYGSSLGRFMSPDPSGGHLVNPQSLNRYAYVHDNPLSMIDPTGLDCVYVNDDQTTAKVVRGDCLKKNDGGIYVNGKIDVNSFRLTQGENGDSLTFNFMSKDMGKSVLFQTNLPSLSSLEDGFGSWAYASRLFSQVGSNPAVRMVSTTRGIATFYGASAALAAGGLAATEFGPYVASQLASLQPAARELAREMLLDPRTSEFVTDFINGYTPGAVRATWGSLTGVAASEVVTHWSQVSHGLQSAYQLVKASVPH